MSTTPIRMLPVLSSVTGILTDIHEITASIIRFVMCTPGTTSSYVEEELVSFRYLAGKVGYDKDQMCKMLEVGLTGIFQRYFPDHTPIVAVTNAPYEGNELEFRYTITIDVTYRTSDGDIISGIEAGTFLVDSDNRITLKFNNSSTTI